MSSDLSSSLLGPALTPLRIPVPASLLSSLPRLAPIQPLLKKASSLSASSFPSRLGRTRAPSHPKALLSRHPRLPLQAQNQWDAVLGLAHTRPARLLSTCRQSGFPVLPSCAGLREWPSRVRPPWPGQGLASLELVPRPRRLLTLDHTSLFTVTSMPRPVTVRRHSYSSVSERGGFSLSDPRHPGAWPAPSETSAPLQLHHTPARCRHPSTLPAR